MSGVAWSPNNSAGTLAHVDLRVLDGQPMRLDGFRLGSWAGAEGRLETVTVTAIGSSAPAWQFTGLIGVGNLANATLAPGAGGEAFRAAWREHLFAAMSRNAGGVVDYFRLPGNAVVELGTRVNI